MDDSLKNRKLPPYNKQGAKIVLNYQTQLNAEMRQLTEDQKSISKIMKFARESNRDKGGNPEYRF